MLSFEEWCQQNDHQDFLDRWDAEKNECLPCEVSVTDKRMFYFKCPRGLHDSELAHINTFHKHQCKAIHCKKCESFAQFVLDNCEPEFFDTIWSKNNTVNPWSIYAKSSKTFVLLNCMNGHGEYTQSCESFAKGSGCPICGHRRLKNNNTLLELYPHVVDLWSEKNNKSPEWYSKKSAKMIWLKCHNDIHEDYQRRVYAAVQSDFTCPICNYEGAIAGRRKDIMNCKFGELTVIGRDDDTKIKKKSDSMYWFCLCSCGKIISAPTNLLNSGAITTCGNKSIHRSGEKNGSWKGGITPENLIARTSKQYISWRNKVYEKDWYTCQCCGRSKDIIKHAHHIMNFSHNKQLRFDIDNGITLCKECHYSTCNGSFHNIYGTSNNTPEQLEEYINNKRSELGLNVPFSLQSYQSGIRMKPKNMMEETYGRTE